MSKSAAYGFPARNVPLDDCERSVSMLMRRFAHAEGQRGAVQIQIDLIVRHKGTVKGFSLI